MDFSDIRSPPQKDRELYKVTWNTYLCVVLNQGVTEQEIFGMPLLTSVYAVPLYCLLLLLWLLFYHNKLLSVIKILLYHAIKSCSLSWAVFFHVTFLFFFILVRFLLSLWDSLRLDCDARLAGLSQIVDDKYQRKKTCSCWKMHYNLCDCKDKTLEGQLKEGFPRFLEGRFL